MMRKRKAVDSSDSDSSDYETNNYEGVLNIKSPSFTSNDNEIAPNKRAKKIMEAGEAVKQKNMVLCTRYSKSKQVLNVNCRVESFARIMSSLKGRKLEIVESMGFGALKHLTGQSINNELGYWLMTRVDTETGVLKCGDGREFVLAPVQVQCVLGIPMGQKAVPIKMEGETMTKQAKKISSWYGKVANGKAGISIGMAQDEVLDENSLFDEEKFRVGFLIVLLGMFLCPSTNFSFLSSNVMTPSLCAAEGANEYDWCSFVLECLLQRVKTFLRTFKKDGFATGCGGCTYFLSISYLDHLDRRPFRWGQYPRIRVWTKDVMKKFIDADKRSGGDFGKSKTVDVAYGENHPRGARDVCRIDHVSTALAFEEVANRIGGDVCKAIEELVLTVKQLAMILENAEEQEHTSEGVDEEVATPRAPNEAVAPTPTATINKVATSSETNEVMAATLGRPTPVTTIEMGRDGTRFDVDIGETLERDDSNKGDKAQTGSNKVYVKESNQFASLFRASTTDVKRSF